MKPTFEKTMDLLVRAYLNNTLEHDNCYACAVGNIVASSVGFTFVPCRDVEAPSKNIALNENGGLYYNRGEKRLVGGDWFYTLRDGDSRGLTEVAITGYDVDELKRIEHAFETAPKGEDDDAWMFNGLCAVLEVLADIHQVDFSGQSVYEKQLEEIYATK